MARAPACVTTAAACLFAATAGALDVSKPDEACKAMLRIVGDLDGKLPTDCK